MGKVANFFKSKFFIITLAVTAVLTTVGAAAFVGSDKGNFAPKYESVAFINSDTPANSYYTIEDALKAAQPGSTVYVRPGKNPIFMGSKTDPAQNIIKEKVTLSLPLSFDTAGKAYYGWTVKEGEAIYRGEAYNIYTNATNVLTNQLTIAEGATLINYGTIYIGGELSGGGGASSGHTQGKYAKIHMMNKSSIICGEENGGKRGNIKCLGYITEEDGADSNVIFNKGDLRMPFLVRDFRGGNASLSVYYPYTPGGFLSDKHAISPFNQFELRNIESRLHLSYYSTLNAYCNLYAGDRQNSTIGRIVGGDPTSLIEFTDPLYSSLTAKYHKDTEICDLYFYGGVKMNALTLTLKVPVVGDVTIDTSSVYFPLSWRYQIELCPAEGQSKAFFDIKKMIKFLPGCSLTIRKGAVLNVNNLTSFDISKNPRTDPGYNDESYAIAGTKYVNSSYPKSKTNAKIVVDGELSVGGLGGYITPGLAGSLLSISSSASQITYEATKENKLVNCDQDMLTNPARGIVGSPDAKISNLSTLSYVSQGTYWVVNNINYTVVYKSFMEETGTIVNYDGNGNITSGNTTQNYTLNTPTYASDPSIKFAGWYYDVKDGECVDYIENNVLTGSAVAGHLNGGTVVTVYARWVKARTIRVEYLTPIGINSTFTEFTKEALTGLDYGLPDGNKISFTPLKDPNNKAHYTGYKFESWSVMDANQTYLPGYENCTGNTVLIPNDYAYDVIYIVPNYSTHELYKLQFTGDRCGFVRNKVYIANILTDIKNGTILYLPLGTTIKVDLLHYKTDPKGKTQCDVWDLDGKRIAGPIKSEGLLGSDKTTGEMPLGEKGMRINLGSI